MTNETLLQAQSLQEKNINKKNNDNQQHDKNHGSFTFLTN